MTNLVLPEHTDFERMVKNHIESLVWAQEKTGKSFSSEVGDDYWHSITDKKGKVWDINIWMDEGDKNKYKVTVYGVEPGKGDYLQYDVTKTDEWASLEGFHDFIMETKKKFVLYMKQFNKKETKMRSPKKGDSGRSKYLQSPSGYLHPIGGDKRFVIDCYGENWSMNWLKRSDITLKELFEHYDVTITEMDDEEVIYRP